MEDMSKVIKEPKKSDAPKADDAKVNDSKLNAPKAVNVVGQITEITGADNGSIVVSIVDAKGEIHTVWINENFWTKLASRFKEGMFVNVTLEKRVAGKTQYINDAGETATHTKDGLSFQGMVRSSEYAFAESGKRSIGEDLDIITQAKPEYATAIAAYLAARK